MSLAVLPPVAILPSSVQVFRGEPFTRLTDEEFFALCQDNAEWRYERNAHHEILVMPPAGTDSSRNNNEISGQLWLWNRQAQLGQTFDSSAGFTLPDASVRSPDAAWLSQVAWEALTAEQRRRFAPVCPEFVVEVKSPSDGLRYLQAKMEDYLTNGVQLGFLLDIEAETAYVYRPGQPMETLTGFDRDLSGGPVLPGFALDLRPLRRAV
jgi:Uma2 family endonuclease